MGAGSRVAHSYHNRMECDELKEEGGRGGGELPILRLESILCVTIDPSRHSLCIAYTCLNGPCDGETVPFKVCLLHNTLEVRSNDLLHIYINPGNISICILCRIHIT